MPSRNSRLFNLLAGSKNLRDRQYRNFNFYELRLLYMISNRYTNAEIAAKLFISMGTARNLRAKIYKKLDLKGTKQQRRQIIVDEVKKVLEMFTASYFDFTFEEWMLENLLAETIQLKYHGRLINPSLVQSFFRIAAVEPRSNEVTAISSILKCSKSNIYYTQKQIIDELSRINFNFDKKDWTKTVREICLDFLEEYKINDEE